MIQRIVSFWNRLTCKHKVDKLRFVRKIYGDEINKVDGLRYEYKCTKCGQVVYTPIPVSCDGCRYLSLLNDGSFLCHLRHPDHGLWFFRAMWKE